MTDTIDTLRDYQAARWRRLAEQRLEHVTELFVSGRWTKYFEERHFLEIIRQSKTLVETWRKLEPATGHLEARLPDLPFAARADEVRGPADSTQAELAAVALAMVEIEAPDASTVADAEPDELAFVGDPKEPRLASLLPSPFEDAIGAVAMQRLRGVATIRD